jgi:hypothetical protein
LPSASSIDSQTVKGSEVGSERVYDDGKNLHMLLCLYRQGTD